MKTLARLKLARLAWALSAILAACVFAHAQESAKGAPSASTEPVATPAAAGTTGNVKKPLPVAEDSLEDEEGPPAKLEDDEVPEPFLCEFSWMKKDAAEAFGWVNAGSDYPRIIPPVTKRELLSAPFSRSKSNNGPSWGTCAEIEESTNLIEINVMLYAHAAKSKTAPDTNTGRCRWLAPGKLLRGKSRVRVRVGDWGGIEFETTDGERKRFSVHWPEKTQSESDGAYCRSFAQQMNKNGALSRGFKKLVLSDMNSKE